MGIEIERKFLLHKAPRQFITHSSAIEQGYLSQGPRPTVRVRIRDQKAFITVKGPSEGSKRSEFEWQIPLQDAREMLDQLCDHRVYKIRHLVPAENGLVWEVDEFLGQNQGLWVAEIELPTVDTAFSTPDWIAAEVTGDHRYSNSQLSQRPFQSWSKED